MCCVNDVPIGPDSTQSLQIERGWWTLRLLTPDTSLCWRPAGPCFCSGWWYLFLTPRTADVYLLLSVLSTAKLPPTQLHNKLPSPTSSSPKRSRGSFSAGISSNGTYISPWKVTSVGIRGFRSSFSHTTEATALLSWDDLWGYELCIDWWPEWMEPFVQLRQSHLT